MQSGRLPEAGTLAAKLCTVHNDTGAITGYADALTAAGHFAEVLQVYQQYCDRLVATDSGKVLESLHSLIGHMREDVPALEILLDLSQKAGDTTHVTELYELLAHASVQAGNLEKARDYYLKLTQLEPQNQLHTRNYEQVLAKLGGAASGSRLITPEEGAVLVEELEATAPFIDQRYADDIALAVRAALTDAELFVSYNMPAKALGPLMSALPKAPVTCGSTSAWPRCTPGPAASAKPRFAAAIWNSFITMPDIPTKPAATAIWPASTRSALPPSRSKRAMALAAPAMPFAPGTITPPAFDHFAALKSGGRSRFAVPRTFDFGTVLSQPRHLRRRPPPANLRFRRNACSGKRN